MSNPQRQKEFSWNLLYEFLTITKHDSFTSAARSIGVTRPAIGQKIRRFESVLGFQLVEREPGNRYFSLTKKGEELRTLAVSIEAGLQRLRGEAVAPTPTPNQVTPLEQAQAIQSALQVLITLLRDDSHT